MHWHRKLFLLPNPEERVPEFRFVPEVSSDGGKRIETVTLPDFYLCSYCPFIGDTPEQLAEHVDRRHTSCSFQCSVCFFRARVYKIVRIHAIVAHPTKEAHTLHCKSLVPSVAGEASVEAELGVEDLGRYQCGVMGCSFSCFHPANLVSHVKRLHAGVKELRCRLCQHGVACTETDIGNFLLHMNLHAVGLFQCVSCPWASDLPADVLLHQCLMHPFATGKVLMRVSGSNKNSATGVTKTLQDYWAVHLPHAYSNDELRQIDMDHTFKELFNDIQVVESDLALDKNVTDVDCEERLGEKPQQVIEVLSKDLFKKSFNLRSLHTSFVLSFPFLQGPGRCRIAR